MGKQTIVIATTPNRYYWLQECMNSFFNYDKYPIMILSDYSYFYGKMKFIRDNTDIEEFVMWPDSMVVKNTKLFDILFYENKGKNVSFSDKVPYDYWMTLGKFKTETLRKITINDVFTKYEELMEEIRFRDEMVKADPEFVGLFNNLPFDENITNPNSGALCSMIEKFGQRKRVIENEYFIKYQTPQ